jgi:hypothetical protein
VPLPSDVESVAGAQELYDWFGYWPHFHDAEIIKFHLDSGTPSTLAVHTWEMTNKVNAVGFYELIKHVVVEFSFGRVTSVNLQNPWEHSILFDLEIHKMESGFRIDLSSSYGLSGTIEANEVSVQIAPGKPATKDGLSS